MKWLTCVLVLLLSVAACTKAEDVTTPNDSAKAVPLGESVAYCPEINFDLLDCENHQGSDIELTGTVNWPGVKIRLIASNNAKGTHLREDPFAEIVVIEAGELSFEKEPVRGGVGGNPHFWWVVTDDAGNWIAEPVYVGRCVQGGK